MQEKSQAPFRTNQERTCVGCGKVANLADLVRTVNSARGPVPDAGRCRSGRGAWVHPSGLCVERAVKRGFSRAFRTQVSASAPELWQMMMLEAEQKTARLLRGGYRGGQVLALPSRVLEALRSGQSEAVVVAQSHPDQAPQATSGASGAVPGAVSPTAGSVEVRGAGEVEEAVLKEAAQAAIGCGKAVAWGNPGDLGRLTHGQGPVSIAAVVDKHLAMRLFRTSAIFSAPGPDRNKPPVVRGVRKAFGPEDREKDVKAR